MNFRKSMNDRMYYRMQAAVVLLAMAGTSDLAIGQFDTSYSAAIKAGIDAFDFTNDGLISPDDVVQYAETRIDAQGNDYYDLTTAAGLRQAVIDFDDGIASVLNANPIPGVECEDLEVDVPNLALSQLFAKYLGREPECPEQLWNPGDDCYYVGIGPPQRCHAPGGIAPEPEVEPDGSDPDEVEILCSGIFEDSDLPGLSGTNPCEPPVDAEPAGGGLPYGDFDPFLCASTEFDPNGPILNCSPSSLPPVEFDPSLQPSLCFMASEFREPGQPSQIQDPVDWDLLELADKIDCDMIEQVEWPATDLMENALAGYSSPPGPACDEEGGQTSSDGSESCSTSDSDEDSDAPCGAGGDDTSSDDSGAAYSVWLLSPNPVDLLTGQKIERITDLVVKLPGRDFRLRREYVSELGTMSSATASSSQQGTFTAIGNGWNLNTINFLEVFGAATTAPQHAGRDYLARAARLVGQKRNARTMFYDADGTDTDYTLKAETSSGSEITYDIDSIAPENTTFTLHRRNGSRVVYALAPNHVQGPQQGMNLSGSTILVPRYAYDEFGNQIVYQYAYPGSSGDGFRLVQMRFYAAGDTESELSYGQRSAGDMPPLAVLVFRYAVAYEEDAQGAFTAKAINGKVAEVVLFRPKDPASGYTDLATNEVEENHFRETKRVMYTYKDHAGDFFHESAAPGDLIQVRQIQREDFGWNGFTGANAGVAGWPGYPHSMKVTQYRYHIDDSSSSDDWDGSVDVRVSVPAASETGRLAMVFSPKSIEYLAQRRGFSNPPTAAARLRVASWYLLRSNNTSLTASDTFEDDTPSFFSVYDIASKIIRYDTESRVETQYIATSGCGCAVEGYMEQVFSYVEGQTSGTYVTHRSTSYDERYDLDSDSSYETFRTVTADYERLDPSAQDSPFVKRFHVVEEHSTTTPGTIDQRWVTENVWDGRRSRSSNLIATITPRAMQSNGYVAATATATATCSRLSGEEVMAYVYTDHGMRSEVRVGDAGSTAFLPAGRPTADVTNGTLVTKTTYGDGSSIPAYLPTKIERFADATVTADTTETTSIEYGFAANGGRTWERLVREAPLIAEGGPASSGSGLVTTTGPGGSGVGFRWYRAFDEQGRTEWIWREDDTFVKYSYDARTGVMSGMTENASPSTSPVTGLGGETLPSPLPAAAVDAPPARVTSYEIDDLGRVRSRTAPGGNDPDTATSVTTRRRYGFVPVNLPHNERTTVANASDPDDTYLFSGTRVALHAVADFPVHLTQEVTNSGPAVVSWYDADGRLVVRSSFTISPAAYQTAIDNGDDLFTLIDSDNEVARMRWDYDRFGKLRASHVWRDMPGGRYEPAPDTTRYRYDRKGDLVLSISPEGEYMGYAEHDAFGRAREFTRSVEGGTPFTYRRVYYDNDTATADSPLGGDGRVAIVELIPGGTAGIRRTVNEYDARNRLIRVARPEKPHSLYGYDNLDRLTAIASTTSDTQADPMIETDRISFATIAYDQAGQPYQQQRAIEPSSATSNLLTSRSWFDERGRRIGSWSTASSLDLVTYNPFSEVTSTYVTDHSNVAGSNPATCLVDGELEDVLDARTQARTIEKAEITYSASGNPVLTALSERRHDAVESGGASLGLGTSPVTTYSTAFFDEANRPRVIAQYGSNRTDDLLGNGTAPSWPPAGSPTSAQHRTSAVAAGALVTSMAFDGRGRMYSVTDPSGREERRYFDDSNRVITTIENFQSAALEVDGHGRAHSAFLNAATDGTERITTVVYNAQNQVSSLAAHVYDGTSWQKQITDYDYALPGAVSSDLPAPVIESESLLYSITYPTDDAQTAATDADRVFFSYNGLGEIIGAKDQNGTVHGYERDAVGRIITDKVQTYGTIAGSYVDTYVKSIETLFDSAGRVTSIQSLASDGTTITNEAGYTYTGLHQIETFSQNPVGELGAAGELSVRYDYDTVTALQAAMAYPSEDATEDTIEFIRGMNNTGLGGASGSDTDSDGYVDGYENLVDDDISRRVGRVTALRLPEIYHDGSASVAQNVVEYDYLGGGTPIYANNPMGDFKLDFLHNELGDELTDAYQGFDEFRRPRRWNWVAHDFDEHPNTADLPNRVPLYARAMSFDSASNMVTDFDARVGATWSVRDKKYAYDGLHRLAAAQRGVIADASDPASTFTDGADGSVAGKRWKLDALGNWNETDFDADGDGVYDEIAENIAFTGFHNLANERTKMEREVVPPPPFILAVSPEYVYDNNGNLLREDRNSVKNAAFYYDAWNRLVRATKFTHTGSTVEHDVGLYEYNGLHHRTTREADLTDTGTPDGIDAAFNYYYSPGWQLLEEHIDTDDDPMTSPDGPDGTTDTIAQQFWGLRYIDDALMRRVERSPGASFRIDIDGSQAASDDDLYFYLTNHQFSVVGLTDMYGVVHSRIDYAPYGEAHHRWAGDVNHDGAVDSVDGAAFTSMLSGGKKDIDHPTDYEVDYDLWRGGESAGKSEVNSLDQALWSLTWNGLSALPAGDVGTSKTFPSAGAYGYRGTGNTIGFTGHRYDKETGLYLARFRSYAPRSGRWMQRDPLGYVDGGNLYEYVASGPSKYVDPTGLKLSEAARNSLEGQCTAFRKRIRCERDPQRRERDIQQYENGPCNELHALDKQMLHAFWSGFGEGLLDAITDPHVILEGLGMIPIIGEPADLVNALWYALEGEWTDAGLSMGAAVPFLGYFANTAKAGRRISRGVRNVGPVHKHHSDPMFMGGARRQRTTSMPASEHRALHRDMNNFLRSRTDEFGNHMRPQRGNSSVDIQGNFTRDERLEALAEFYRQHWHRYPDAARDFFRQHPGQR